MPTPRHDLNPANATPKPTLSANAAPWYRPLPKNMNPGIIDIEAVKATLRTERVGKTLHWCEQTPSTNDLALELLTSPEADGLVVVAEHQTRGRGRLGRPWNAPKGAGLLASFALVDENRQVDGPSLGLLVAVAACDAVHQATNLFCRIKWPNDLLVNNRKVGGILIESRSCASGHHAYIVGIGINCLQQQGHLPPELRPFATSLDMESSRPINRTELLIQLIQSVDRWLSTNNDAGADEIHHAWRQRCDAIGQRIAIRQGGRVYSGTMIDVDPRAALVLHLDRGGIRTFNAAESTVCREHELE